ncbi:restriction endonuclease subunit S [Shewanella chilikensis]|uniref:restriction endonuclease subunit S n=1 Tax=Shewanella chilikensis TaxID=558541 RepID=UPI0013F46740|nr:restriction endonuclease subunit S [Shewanella chilikensis]
MTEQQLPEGWQMVKFGDIAKHISKRVEPSETELEVYVGLEHLDPDSLKIKRHGVPSDVAGQKLLVKKGQIIFGKRRAYQRKVAVADWDCICSAHAMVLEANTKNVIPDFLPFFMQSDVFMNRAVAISEGSLSPTIKWKVLSNQEFLIPTKDKQVAIVEVLKKRFDLEQKYINVISSAQQVSNAILGYRKNNNFKTEKLKNLISKHIDYRGKSPPKSDSGIPLITAKNIRDGFINEDPREFISCDDFDSWMTRGIPKEKDILFTTEAPLGNVAFAPNYKFALGQRTVCFRARDSEISPETLFWALRTKYFTHKLESRTTGTTAQGIKVKELLQLSVNYPEKSLSPNFSGLLEQVNQISLQVERALKSMPTVNEILRP